MCRNDGVPVGLGKRAPQASVLSARSDRGPSPRPRPPHWTRTRLQGPCIDPVSKIRLPGPVPERERRQSRQSRGEERRSRWAWGIPSRCPAPGQPRHGRSGPSRHMDRRAQPPPCDWHRHRDSPQQRNQCHADGRFPHPLVVPRDEEALHFLSRPAPSMNCTFPIPRTWRSSLCIANRPTIAPQSAGFPVPFRGDGGLAGLGRGEGVPKLGPRGSGWGAVGVRDVASGWWARGGIPRHTPRAGLARGAGGWGAG